MSQIDIPAVRSGGSTQLSAAIHVGFVITGVVTTMLGPVLPELTRRWSLDDAQAGYLFTAQFMGSMTAAACSGWLSSRLGLSRALCLGLGAMSAGVAGLIWSSYAAGLASVFVFGLGLGTTIPATNLLVAEWHPDRRAAALNLLNFSWSIGAVASPPPIGFAIEGGYSNQAFAGIALFAIGTAAWIYWLRGGHATGSTRRIDQGSRGGLALLRDPVIVLIGAFVFLYVGTETSIGGWISSYSARLGRDKTSLWWLSTTMFWGALLAGRAAAPALLLRISESSLVRTGLIISCGGIALLLFARGNGLVFAGAFLAGIGFASVFPNTVARLSRHFGEESPRAASPVFVCAGLGGAVVPWLVGRISASSGSLRVGLLVPLASTVLMIGLQRAVGSRQ